MDGMCKQDGTILIVNLFKVKQWIWVDWTAIAVPVSKKANRIVPSARWDWMLFALKSRMYWHKNSVVLGNCSSMQMRALVIGLKSQTYSQIYYEEESCLNRGLYELLVCNLFLEACRCVRMIQVDKPNKTRKPTAEMNCMVANESYY